MSGTLVSKRHWARKHDVLLFYAMPDYAHNPIQERVYYDKPFFTTETDEAGRHYADVYLRNVWVDIKAVINVSRNRTGYPTQKPLGLYLRVIEASSNEGGTVLDPFAGCATTCIAAERLGREWVGIDIWDKAREVVLDRLKVEGLAADGDSGGMLPFGDVHYETKPPIRTDEGGEAVAYLQVRERIKEPEGKNMSRAEMYDFLLAQYGWKCQGCDRTFDDPRYLQLDHNTPRADGGLNHIQGFS